MKRFFRAIGVVAFLIAATAGASWSQSVENSDDGAVQGADGNRLYFVELMNAPTADGGDAATIDAEQAAFRTKAGQSNIHYNENAVFKKLFNGFSISASAKDLAKLRRMAGVGAIYPVFEEALEPMEPGDEIDLATALHQTGADYAQNTLGLTGAGVKVGIIDTGQDYDHLDLGGDGVARQNSPNFPSSRALVGHDFVGDAWAPGLTPVPDAFPDDCNGHGTHVSGIVGANGGVTGVAPGVTFGVYKVFGCGTTTQTDVMLLAMEQAFDDGMQIINMSIGAARQWPSYPTAAATKRLVNHGMVVVAAAGNEAVQGLYGSAAPGVGEKTIQVASFDNTHTNSAILRVNGQAFVFTPATGGFAGIPTSGTETMSRTGTPASAADGCTPPLAGISGTAVLIRRGTCGFYNKAINAQNAGAVAVILYNNQAAAVTPNIAPVPAGAPVVTIPVVIVNQTDGATINNMIAAGPTTLAWTDEVVSTPNANGGFISSFSSWGVSPDLTTKPDLGAPGGLIRSTYPIEQGSYAILSGTSMASPHVAGSVALLLEAHPNTPPNAVRDILMNSADPHGFNAANPTLLMSVHRQGAGMLDIPGMILANTRIEPGKLSLGETSGGSVVGSFTIRNNSDHTISYALGHSPAVATGPATFSIAAFIAPSAVSFDVNPVVVPAGGSATVNVTATANAALADRSLFGGYIDVTPDDGSPDYSVPFTGFKGDYQTQPALLPTANGFPWLAKQVGTSLVKQTDGAVYSLIGTDIPILVLHVENSVSLLRAEVFEVGTNKTWHRFDNESDLGHNSSATAFYTLGWDGTTVNGNKENVVPNGNYYIVMTVVRALGDANNPAHVETFTSPTFFLARPDISLESFSVSQPSVNVGDQVVLSAAVRNTRVDPTPRVHVEFFDNDVLVGASDVDLAAGQTAVVEQAWTVGPDNHHLKVRVDPLPTEEITVNNEWDLQANIGAQIVGVGGPNPRVLALAPAKPNPSRGNMDLTFSLPKQGPVSLEVFDVSGRRLKSWRWANLEAGVHSIKWDGRTEVGRAAPAGTVLFRLNAMGKTLTQKAARLN